MSYFLKQFVSSQRLVNELGKQIFSESPLLEQDQMIPFIQANKYIPEKQNKRDSKPVSRSISRLINKTK